MEGSRGRSLLQINHEPIQEELLLKVSNGPEEARVLEKYNVTTSHVSSAWVLAREKS